MQTYEVRLKPKGFIQSLQSPSFPSSTTIFGAICWGIRAIYGESKLEDFLTSPPLLISSSFPLLQKENFSLRFFPKPKLPGLDSEEIKGIGVKGSIFHIASKYRPFKKISFLSQSLFVEVLGGMGEEDLFSEYVKEKLRTVGNMAFRKEEGERLGGEFPSQKIFPMARNKIDRLGSSSTGAGEFFHDFRISLPSGTCLFFLLKTEKIDFLKPVLRFLEDSGIGGERTTGANHFYIQQSEQELDFPSKGKKLVTLSRWKVNPEELDMKRKDEFRYELLPWRGKIETGFDFKDKGLLWKRKGFYFTEGSVLAVKKESQSYYGSLWNSLEFEGKKIKDYGIAFPAFFKEG